MVNKKTILALILISLIVCIEDDFQELIEEVSFNTFDSNSVTNIKGKYYFTGSANLLASNYTSFNTIHLHKEFVNNTNIDSNVISIDKGQLDDNISSGALISKNYLHTKSWQVSTEVYSKLFTRHITDYIKIKGNLYQPKFYDSATVFWFVKPNDGLEHYVINNSTDWMNGYNNKFEGFGVGVGYKSILSTYVIFLILPGEGNSKLNHIGLIDTYYDNSCQVKPLGDQKFKITIKYINEQVNIYYMSGDSLHQPCLLNKEVSLPIPFKIIASSRNGRGSNKLDVLHYLDDSQINKISFINFDSNNKSPASLLRTLERTLNKNIKIDEDYKDPLIESSILGFLFRRITSVSSINLYKENLLELIIFLDETIYQYNIIENILSKIDEYSQTSLVIKYTNTNLNLLLDSLITTFNLRLIKEDGIGSLYQQSINNISSYSKYLEKAKDLISNTSILIEKALLEISSNENPLESIFKSFDIDMYLKINRPNIFSILHKRLISSHTSIKIFETVNWKLNFMILIVAMIAAVLLLLLLLKKLKNTKKQENKVKTN